MDWPKDMAMQCRLRGSPMLRMGRCREVALNMENLHPRMLKNGYVDVNICEHDIKTIKWWLINGCRVPIFRQRQVFAWFAWWRGGRDHHGLAVWQIIPMLWWLKMVKAPLNPFSILKSPCLLDVRAWITASRHIPHFWPRILQPSGVHCCSRTSCHYWQSCFVAARRGGHYGWWGWMDHGMLCDCCTYDQK